MVHPFERAKQTSWRVTALSESNEETNVDIDPFTDQQHKFTEIQ